MPDPNNANMTVGLPLGGPLGRLSVGDSEAQNQITAKSQPTNIIWTLGTVLARASFVPMTAQQPGFEWITPGAPPTDPAIFGNAVISNNGATLTVVDNHLDATTNGEWAYILRVSYNGTIYSTTNLPSGPGGTVNRPVIINK